jgi:hypothetical protein
MLEDSQRTPNSKNDGDNFPHLYSTVNSNKNLINQAQGLVGYWSFDEGSGNIARDYSGNGNNGTLYNFNFTATSGWVDGKVGKALIFDGVDDYVRIIRSLSIEPTTLTATAWFKANTLQTAGIFGKHNWIGSIVKGFFVQVMPDGNIFFTTGDGSTGYYYLPAGAGSYENNKWYHIAGVNNGTISKIYLNGKLINTNNSPYSPHSGEDFGIGVWRVVGGPFNGLIDEVRIYNRVLSDSEIKALYEATK